MQVPPITKRSLGVPAVGSALAGLAVSPDGKWLWLAQVEDPSRSASELLSEPGTLMVTLWDLQIETELGSLKSPPVSSPSLVAAGDTQRVLIAHDAGAWLLELATGKAMPIPSLPRNILYGPPHIEGSGRLATTSAKLEGASGLQRVELESGRVVLTISPAEAPFAFSRDDMWLCYVVTPSEGTRLRIARADDGSVVAESPVIEDLRSAKVLALDATGRVVAWYQDGRIGVWRVGDEAKSQQLAGMGAVQTPALAFGPGGRMLYCLTKGSMGQIHIVDTTLDQAEMDRLAHEKEHGEAAALDEVLGYVQHAEIAASGASAIVASYESLTRYSLTEAGAARGTAIGGPAIDCLAVMSQLGFVVTGSRHGSAIACRTPGSSPPLQVFDAGCQGVRELHCGPDGASLYIVGMDGSISHFAPLRDPPLTRWPCPYVYSSLFTIEANGRHAVCTHGLVDGSRGRGYGGGLSPEKQDGFTVWELGSGRLLADLKDVPAPAQALVWVSGRSDVVRIRQGTQITTHDVRSGEQIESVSFPLDWQPSCPEAQLLPGGERVLTIEKGRIVIWDLTSQRAVADVCEAEGTHILAIDPQGRRAVLSTRESGVAICRLDREKECEQPLAEALDHEAATIAAWNTAGDQLVLVTLSQRVVSVST
jgi:hypothetical protein